MTHNTFTRIQFQNRITERDRRAQDVADARELVTPFTIVPGTPIVDVTLMDAYEPDEIKIALGFAGGTQEVRSMPNTRKTHQLVFAYAQAATNGIQVCSKRVNWSS